MHLTPQPRATHIVQDDQWTVDTANGVVSYPRLDRHHAGVYCGRHGGGSEQEGSLVKVVVEISLPWVLGFLDCGEVDDLGCLVWWVGASVP